MIGKRRIDRILVGYVSSLFVMILTGCDAGSTGYLIDTDSNTVKWVTRDAGHGRRESTVEGADAKSFETLSFGDNHPFGKDRNHVYLRASRIEGADPASFRNAGSWYRDEDSVFLFVDGQLKRLHDANPESFERLATMFWTRDDTRVFFQDRGFIPEDLDSFELLDGLWARDNVACYHRDRKVENADLDTFVVDDKFSAFARDSKRVYWKGWLIRECDPKTFLTTSPNEGRDEQATYYCILKDEHNYGIKYRDNETIEVIRRKIADPQTAQKP